MYIFSLVIIPLIYVISECICHNRKVNRNQIVCIFTGLVIASIYTLIDFFAIGSAHSWIASIVSIWSHYFITEIIIPVVVCSLPVIFAKDSLRMKAQSLVPILTAFYAVFVPYKIFSSGVSPDVYEMILYPFLMATMLFNVDTAASAFEEGVDVSRLLWLRCLIAFVAVASGIMLPSIFSAYYYLNSAGALMWVLMGLFLVSSAGFRVLTMLFLTDRHN